MTERIHAVAVDMGHRAGRPERQIAADEHDADAVTRFQRSFKRLLAGMEAGGVSAHRDEALFAERAAEHVGDFRLEPGHHERRRDRTEQRAELRAADVGDGGHAGELRVAGSIGERSIPVQGLAEGGLEVLARERILEAHARAGGPRRVQRGRVRHLGDRRDAGNRFLREATQRIRHGADEPVVDVHRAAAHARNDPGVGERTALQPGQDEVSLRADDVLEHAQDVRFELLDMGAVEHRVSDAHHPGTNLGNRHLNGGPAQAGRRQRQHGGTDAGKREQDW